MTNDKELIDRLAKKNGAIYPILGLTIAVALEKAVKHHYYRNRVKWAFEWLIGKFVMVGAAMVGLWILGIVMLVSKIVGEDGDEKRERD